MSERRRLNYGDRKIIEDRLESGWKLKDIAEELECDPTAISREILRNRIKLEPVAKSRFKIITCQKFGNCQRTGLCANKCKKRCRSCHDHRCEEKCSDFVEFNCGATTRFPHVCNGCRFMNRCPKQRYSYKARAANKAAMKRAREPRQGFDLTEDEIKKIAKITCPLVAQGHSPKVIVAKHPELDISASTLYRLIDSNILEVALNMKLPRKMRFKKRKRVRVERSPRRDLAGRDYDAFCLLPEEIRKLCKEMDTVIGRPGGKCLLTFCFRENDIFYAILMEDKTANSVVCGLDDVEMAAADGGVAGELGVMVILTDNGGEFDHFEDMERSCFDPESGEKRINVYYCDPYSSWQKPHIENAHTLLRRILPKGSSFDDLTQEDVNLICSHINSYPREDLDWLSPFEKLPEWGQENLPKAFGMHVIPSDEVILKPSLLAHRKLK